MSSKSKNKCKTDTYNLFYDDFSNGFDPNDPNSPYAFFAPFTQDAAGGVIISKNSLTINSSPFTITNPTPFDNFKYGVSAKQSYNAPLQGELVFETIISSEQTGLTNIPSYLQATNGSLNGINNINSDYRPCYSFYSVAATTTYLYTGFLLSKGRRINS